MEQSAGAVMGGAIGLVLVVIVGLIVGAVARFLMPGPDPGGWIVTALLGIAGSWVGGFIFGMLGFGSVGLLGAIIGAMVILGLYRMVKRA